MNLKLQNFAESKLLCSSKSMKRFIQNIRHRIFDEHYFGGYVREFEQKINEQPFWPICKCLICEEEIFETEESLIEKLEIYKYFGIWAKPETRKYFRYYKPIKIIIK